LIFSLKVGTRGNRAPELLTNEDEGDLGNRAPELETNEDEGEIMANTPNITLYFFIILLVNSL